MGRFTIDKLMSFWSVQTSTTIVAVLVITILSINNAHSAWFERLLLNNKVKEDTHTVKNVERDDIFTIDDFIYDARQTCDLSVGDRVVFFQGRYGVDYRATVYDVDSREPCELLLRDPVS